MFTLILSLAFANDSNLRDALNKSDESHLQHSIVSLEAQKQRLQKNALLSQVAPMLSFNINWMYFGESLDVNLMGEQDIDCNGFEALGFGDLCTSFNEPMRLRDDTVFESTVQGAMPLTALYSLFHGIEALKTQESITQLKIQQQKATVRVEVVKAYLDVLTLQNAATLSEKMAGRLQAKRDDLSEFVNQGLASSLDLDRLNNALHQAKIAKQQAISGQAIAQKKLDVLVGVAIVVTPFSDSTWTKMNLERAIPIDSHSMTQTALKSHSAAVSASKGVWGQALPQLSLVAGVMHQNGQGELTPASQRYVGINFNGQFNWGKRIHDAKRADLTAAMALQSIDSIKQQVGIIIEGTKMSAENAFMDLTIKQRLLKTALKAHQQTQVEFEQQLKSATDLLESETERLKAEMDLLKAKRDVLAAVAEYQAAAGLTVDPQAVLGE